MNITRAPQPFVPLTITFESNDELNAFLRILDTVGNHPLAYPDTTMKLEAISIKNSVMQFC